MRGHKISWADMCSSGSESETCSDSSSLPGLESDNESDSGCSTPSAPSSIQGEVEAAAEVIEEEEEGGEEEEETADFLDPESEPEECARVFLWAAPANAHDGEDGSRWGPGGEASARSREPFHKTRMCRTWRQTGHCSFGERCNFAHGVGEMRATEEGLQLLGGGGRGPSTRRQHESSDSSDTASTCSNETNLFGAVGGPLAAHHKTRMCKIFEKSGCCKFTGRCNYAHSREELVVRKSTGRCSADHKTRICKAFMRSGTCPYGDRCTFAHGREELRINVLQL
ncbi:hypothetical protein T484DRAFT_1954042 [Baffinella frigidus]|nr:hypothetical protein T484DRAFT_1954042 [Cryptophyta sp. CCMP2293]